MTDLTFLTHAEVPFPNLLGLQPDERVVIRRARSVVRVGYRVLPSDMHAAAEALLREDPTVLNAYESLAYECTGRSDHYAFRRRIVDAIAYGLVLKAGFGGPDRGIIVRDRPMALHCETTVRSTRVVQVGVRYPGSGSADDWENGGLRPRVSVVLVETDGGEFISGDLDKVKQGGE